MALFANSVRCNGASAAEGRPTVARLASSRQPVTHSGPRASPHAATQPVCLGKLEFASDHALRQFFSIPIRSACQSPRLEVA